MGRVKTLVLDIETSPNLGYVWGLWDQNIGLNQLVNETEVLCWAAKWLDSPEVMFSAVWQKPGRAGMVKRMYDLLDEADTVVHYNGKSFDVPHLNTEFTKVGRTPPAPFRQVDLLLAVRKQFKFPSNKLAYVAPALGLSGKAETGGFELWRGVMGGDRQAQSTMRSYNEQDVLVTEELYHKVLPWIPGHPNHNLYGGRGCPFCGLNNLVRRGFYYTQASKFIKYRCTDCGAYSRNKSREHGVEIQEAVL